METHWALQKHKTEVLNSGKVVRSRQRKEWMTRKNKHKKKRAGCWKDGSKRKNPNHQYLSNKKYFIRFFLESIFLYSILYWTREIDIHRGTNKY